MKTVKHNRTKVVCTIGPASESEEMLKALMLAGMDVARMNFSHGAHEKHAENIQRIKKLRKELGIPIAILQDLQGPKIRIGFLEAPYSVKPGDRIKLSTAIATREGNVLPIQYETFARDVRKNDLILADDGKVTMTVISTNNDDEVELEIIHGDAIGSKKGINLPYTKISLPSLTEKDLEDLEFGLKQDVDWIALSFVRNAEDVRDLKRRIAAKGQNTKVISKIEKPEALANIDEIIEASDGIMVARGDLGVEIPMEDVPMWQKRIIKKCNLAAKPVIVATQMMESMMENRRPTRAETSDVANAVTDGADAVMLSGETSVGKYPVEVVMSMDRILESVESMADIYYKNLETDPGSSTYIHDEIIVHACKLAKETQSNALVGMTVSGYTAFHLSRCRPKSDIFIFTSEKKMLNVLNLVWGVRAFYYAKEVSTDQTIEDTIEVLKKARLMKKDDLIIHCASMPLNARQRTNMVKISKVE